MFSHPPTAVALLLSLLGVSHAANVSPPSAKPNIVAHPKRQGRGANHFFEDACALRCSRWTGCGAFGLVAAFPRLVLNVALDLGAGWSAW